MMLLHGILITIRILPFELAVLLVRLILLIYLAVRSDYRQEIRTNYKLIFGANRPWFWVRNAWRVGRNLTLMAKIGTKFANELVDRGVVCGENYIKRQSLEQDVHTLMASFHFGVWEYLPQFFVRQGADVAVVVSKQRDPVLDSGLRRLRNSNGVKLIVQISGIFRRLSNYGVTGFMLDNTARGRSLTVHLARLNDGNRLLFRVPALPFEIVNRQRDRGKNGVAGVVPIFGYLKEGRLVIQIFPAGDAASAVRALLTMVKAMPEEWIFWGKAGAIKLIEAQ